MSFRKILPGISIIILISALAWWLGLCFPLIGSPVFGILLGIVSGLFLSHKEILKGGIQFSSKKVLQYAVILLGFGLNFSQIFAVGSQSLPIILATILSALLTAYLFQKIFHFDKEVSTLVGVGSSICGGSAIAATAPIIKAKDSEIATAISVIFFYNILAALLFPHLGSWLGMSNHGFAIFAGTAVNDTSSVTATASSWDAIHQTAILNEATVVKLTRTLAIIPITLFLSLHQIKKSHAKAQSSYSIVKAFPKFIIWFLLASLITTFLTSFGFSTNIFTPLKSLSKFMIVMAMTAIGFNTNPKKLVREGGHALILGGVCWIIIICVSLGIQKLLGLW
ncbi:YeiH family protein [Streptococcus dentiloxodontae]